MIRPYTITDKEILLGVFKLNVPFYFALHEADEYKKYLEANGSSYFTIEYDNKIVGGVGYNINIEEATGSITWIFLHPDYSGLKLGKQAVEHCMTILEMSSEVKKLVIRTSQLAYIFFERFGYEVVFTQKNYWGQNLDLYYMEKTLEK
jgi:ribosomal protein S18 acetylase RimI-like enzyme